MKKNKIFTIIIIIIVLILVLFIGIKYFLTEKQNSQEIEEDVISYNDMIKVFQPLNNKTISSPLNIQGEARGNWFFEASFPIKMIDENGKEIPLNINYITTDKEWFTEDYISFSEKITFDKPDTKNGTLILKKANPSGMPEKEEKLEIPIKFKANLN